METPTKVYLMNGPLYADDLQAEINSGLLNLLPKGAEKEATTRIGFGL